DEVLVRLRVGRSQALSDRHEIDVRLIEGDVALEPPEHAEALALSARRRERIGLKRNPELVVVRKCETIGHDADDGERLAVHPYEFSNDVRLAGVSLLPRRVGENEHFLTARRVFARAKSSAEHRA